jgi:hypothetical protein
MSYDNSISVSQNVLKFYQQLTGEERGIPFIFDDFHFCHLVPLENFAVSGNTANPLYTSIYI